MLSLMCPLCTLTQASGEIIPTGKNTKDVAVEERFQERDAFLTGVYFF